MTDRDSVLERLAALGRTPAPGGLLVRVLTRTGTGYWYAQAPSPLGPVLIGHGPQGIAGVRLAADGAEAFEAWFQAEQGVVIRPEPALPEEILASFEARLAGRQPALHFDLAGRTPFQQSVLHAATTIPRGQVRTYAWVAREIGHPAAVRAVGTALAHNPVALVVPCHRVVPSDLHLGRYSCGGPEQKRLALLSEGLDVDRLERLAGAGVRFLGSDTTRVFCTPSCADAVRITPRHEVRFRTAPEALSAGYEPCRHCRPVGVAA
jgi:O-6-methylguanine DNA methyltransferase